MLRANDLIWNYWVSNYLLGQTPSAFDVLYWNADATGMTAQFNHDFSEFVDDNPLVTAGAMRVRGAPIADLSKLGFDSYVIGARNDHLCIWQSVYRIGPAAEPPQPVHPRQQRPHPDDRLPARQPQGELLHQPRSERHRRRVVGRLRAPRGLVVGARRRLEHRALRRAGRRARDAGQRRVPGAGRGAGHLRARARMTAVDGERRRTGGADQPPPGADPGAAHLGYDVAGRGLAGVAPATAAAAVQRDRRRASSCSARSPTRSTTSS